MLVAIVLIGLPISLVLGVLPAWVLGRRQPGRAEDSFRCRVRVESGSVSGFTHAYPRRWQRGVWMHDVLVVRRGRIFVRIVPLAIEVANELADVPGNFVTLRLRLEDGTVVAVMTERHMTTSLVGPFLMAELEHIDNAESRPRGGGRR